MRLFKYIASCLAVAGSIVAATETKESAVHELNASNMHSWVDRQHLALVQFYAPWCQYCKALEPAYEKAASALEADGVPLAKVDCTKSAALCDQIGIKGFPTLKVVMDGKFGTYNGSRQETGIVSYMRKHKGPPVTKVQPAELSGFVKSDHVVVVGYFKSESSSELAVLREVAKELIEDFTFGFVADKSTAKKQKVSMPSIAIYTDYDDQVSVFSGKYTKENVRKFIRARSVPLLGELSSRTFGTYSKAGLPLGLVFYKTDESHDKLERELLPIAREFRDKVCLTFVDARVYWKHATVLDLKTQWPAFAIQDVTMRTKYPMSQNKEFSTKDVRRFVSDYTAGKVAPHYKSAVIPATNDGDVFKLVSKQFNEVVFDKSKDVLVLLHATWCIHCKRLMPVYEELGKLLKSNANIVIAQMEATLNDVPSNDPALEITGYPTVVLVRAIDNVIVPYHGDRSLNSFTEFLRAHAAHSVTAQNNDIQRISANGPGYMVVPPQIAGFTPKDARHVEL
ncbi:protein disulfide-isomerase precursor [Coemansia sp. RSA 1813]|nr:protein disulfide-isomerase precursor [Coemansia sp. RSA 487]KAJ2568170.1 protein disulfide-isomerase precursor [Coemansia sp. RSA 1813]